MRDESLVTHLCHVGLRVPDPEEAAAFYQRVMGLGVTGRESADGAVRLSALPPAAAVVPHHEIILYPGEPVRLDHMAFGVPDEGALDAAVETLRQRGVAVSGPQQFERAHGPSARFEDPDGLVVELTVPRAPVARPSARRPGESGFDLIRLGHVTRKSPNPSKEAAWWKNTLGFRLSDQMGEEFYWLRCNRDHHSIAFPRADSAGTHHIAFEAKSWEEVRRLGDHFMHQKVRLEFGPGRHGPGNNIFVYFLDPWGVRWEIFCEMVRVDDETTYRPGYWDPNQRIAVVNWWGQPPPESFQQSIA